MAIINEDPVSSALVFQTYVYMSQNELKFLEY